ncbi:beta-glucan synthesis-associated protein [Tilletia horrida]|nr:beta-glucan synthesis-associated protein [Tilletia horrida]
MSDQPASSSSSPLPPEGSPTDPFRASADTVDLPAAPGIAHTRTASKSGQSAVQTGTDHAVSPAPLPPLPLPPAIPAPARPASASLPSQPTQAQAKSIVEHVQASFPQAKIPSDDGDDADEGEVESTSPLSDRIESPEPVSALRSSSRPSSQNRHHGQRSQPRPLSTVAIPKNMRAGPSPQQAQLRRELSMSEQNHRASTSSPTNGSAAPSISPAYQQIAPYAAQMRPPISVHGHQGIGGYGTAQTAIASSVTNQTGSGSIPQVPGGAVGGVTGGHVHSSSLGHVPPSMRSDSVYHNNNGTLTSVNQPLLGRVPGASTSGIVATLPPGPVTVSGSIYGMGRYPFSPSASGTIHSSNPNPESFFMARPGAVNTPGGLGSGPGGHLAVENLYWDEKEKDADDYLHNPDPVADRESQGCSSASPRGALNVLVLFIVVAGILTLFAGYPLISHFTRTAYTTVGAANLGGANGTGQVPDLKIFQLIDPDTPPNAYTFTSPVEGQTQYQLVFSDEFEQEGRTFWHGDDPFWEAVDIWYGATRDYEWYSPEAINTTNGKLQITMEATPTHNLNFQSGMLQSWNKFCYQGGYIEFSVLLPGGPTTKGFWPAAWMMGNLGRPGYLGSTDGMWPYSYDSCDTGILPDQLFLNRTGPNDTLTHFSTYSQKDPPALSLLPGMRLSSCTCPGQDHPGPNVNTGRAAPELDVFEVTQQGKHSYASQTYQIAPFDSAQQWKNVTEGGLNAVLYDTTTRINNYKGTPYQESVSGYAQVPDDGFFENGQRFVKYGVEYFPDWDGSGQGTITWYIDGLPTWTAKGSTLDPSPTMDVGRRIFPVEPLSIIMNLGISSAFQAIDWDPLTGVSFPAVMQFEYVRLYQESDKQKLSCDPADHPTSDYINNHLSLYYNPNLTEFPRDQYTWPSNQLTGC